MSSLGEFEPGRLWNLWEMLTKSAQFFLDLGEKIAMARMVFTFMDDAEAGSVQKHMAPEELAQLGFAFQEIYALCSELDLPTSKELFHKGASDLPQTGREFAVYAAALDSEMKSKMFVFLPHHRRKYFIPSKFIPNTIEEPFPLARNELVEAGKCFAFDRYTASVFHCMRAIEIGLRAMAVHLAIDEFKYPLEQADWEGIIRKIESKILGMKDLPRTAEKDDSQNFNSSAAMEFRYFKDGWRVRVAHTRETYDETSAIRVLEHAVTFIEILSSRLKEPSPSG